MSEQEKRVHRAFKRLMQVTHWANANPDMVIAGTHKIHRASDLCRRALRALKQPTAA